MEKKIYTQFIVLIALVFAGQAFAQKTVLRPAQQAAEKAPSQMFTGLEAGQADFARPAPTTLAEQPIRTRTETELTIGTTVYDLQTNGSICNRFTRTAGGEMYATWTQGADDPNYADRGTGYNSFDGNEWGDSPDSRLEESARTGWPNYVRTEDGTQFIVNHVFDAGSYRLHYLRKPNGSPVWVEGDLPTDTPFGSLWPRAVVGGADGNSIHVISITTSEVLGGVPYEGVNLHIIYHRSQDAGATWDVVDGIIPGLDSTLMYDLARADAYAIDARDDVIAIGLFSPFNDVKVFKSEDNGGTWSDFRIHDFPIDQYVTDQGYSVDDLPPYDSTFSPNPVAIFTADGAGTVLIDNDDMVHAFYGEQFVQDTSTTDGSWFFFPCTNGLAYWNEGFGEDSIRTIAGASDLNGNEVLDVDCTAFDFGRYGLAGLASYPSAGVDADNNIFMSFQMVMEGDEFYNSSQMQRYNHVHLMATLDGGDTWTEPYDLMNEDVLIEPELDVVTEGVFAHVAKYVDDQVHLIYQQDFVPGLSSIGDMDAPGTNYINYVGVDVTEFGLQNSTKEETELVNSFSLMPNPASDMLQVFYELPQNENVILSISNLVGQTILVKKDVTGFRGLNSTSINVGEMDAGVYFLQLNIGERKVTQKLVVR